VPGERLTRRAAIGRALGVAAGATGVLAGLGVLLRGAPPARARAAEAPAATRVAASADVPPGSALPVVNPLDGSSALVIRDADGSLTALGRACTHAGCDVEWTGEELRCPCHHARFDARTGEPTRGPAQAPLSRFEVVERGGDILAV
jgi:nitrite reductase/ring-hydroxylating ferredoxin subunit